MTSREETLAARTRDAEAQREKFVASMSAADLGKWLASAAGVIEGGEQLRDADDYLAILRRAAAVLEARPKAGDFGFEFQLFCANKTVAAEWGVSEMTPFMRLEFDAESARPAPPRKVTGQQTLRAVVESAITDGHGSPCIEPRVLAGYADAVCAALATAGDLLPTNVGAALKAAPAAGDKEISNGTIQHVACAEAFAWLRSRDWRRDGDFFVEINRHGAQAMHVSTVALIVGAALHSQARASEDSPAMLGLAVNTYSLDADTTIERTSTRGRPDRWAVRRMGNCLSTDGHWECEPQPSSRDDEFLKRCRFDTVKAAAEAARACDPE